MANVNINNVKTAAQAAELVKAGKLSREAAVQKFGVVQYEAAAKALNGDKNWGKFDGFEAKTGEWNKEAKHYAEVGKNVKTNYGKKVKVDTHLAEEKKAKQQQQNKVAQSRKKRQEEYNKGNYFAAAWEEAKGLYQAARYSMMPDGSGVQQAGMGAGKLLAAVATAAIVLETTTSCEKDTPDVFIGAEQNVNVSLTMDLKGLQNAIQAIKDGQDVSNAQLKAILNALIQNGTDISEIKKLIGGSIQVLNAILDALTDGNKELKDIKDLLIQNNGQNAEILTAIYDIKNAINKLGQDGQTFATAILRALQNGNMKLDTLIKLTNATNALIARIGSNNHKDMEELKALLAQININIEKGNEADAERDQKILDAINKLGFGITRGMTAILNAINNGNKALGAKLDAILAKMDQMNAAQQAKFNQIIELIGNMNLDTSTIERLLGTIVDQNGKILNSSLKNGETLNKILEKLKDLEAKGDKRAAKFEQILGDILNKMGGSKAYDDTKLLAFLDKLANMLNGKLDDILAAIKDHDVKVTVDVTGKVKCECNCGKPHEGILGDLENILG